MPKRVAWDSVRRYYISLKAMTKAAAIHATAEKFKLTVRGVRKRQTDEGWEADRLSGDVEVLHPSKVISIRQPREERTYKEHVGGGSNAHFDERELLNHAIEGIGMSLAAMNYENLSSAAGASKAFCTLIQLRRELYPKTPADFLRAMDAEGIGPKALNEAAATEWQRQA